MIRIKTQCRVHKIEMYTITIFSKLIESYPSFEELRTFLSSEAGGNLRIIESDEFKQYAIIRYVKERSNHTDESKPWIPWFRSVVWNKETNRPVCVAPRKAMATEFVKGTPCEVEEFVEGVMVNGFVNDTGSLTFTTRSTLGAKKGYYTEKTFAQMMEESMKHFNLTSDSVGKGLQEAGFTFSSFVLQHPEHLMVSKPMSPGLKLIHIGKVEPNGDIRLTENEYEWPQQFQFLKVNWFGVLQPEETPEMRLTQMKTTCVQGLVFRGSNGCRWRYRHPDYMEKHSWIRSSRPEENFARIRSAGTSKEYFKAWPEFKYQYYFFENLFRLHTKRVYEEYCKIHKEHSKQFQEVPTIYRGILFDLHAMYLTSLRPQGQTVKFQTVIQYMNTLPIEGQGFLLRQKV